MKAALALADDGKARWKVELTPEAQRWYSGLRGEEKSRVTAALDELQSKAPAIGRPFVDSIKRSRHQNMKELRGGTNLRALFVFDPGRRAVVLVGGDKAGNWKGWYKQNIPRADRLYDRHLQDLGKEAAWRPGQRRAGRPSGGRSP